MKPKIQLCLIGRPKDAHGCPPAEIILKLLKEGKLPHTLDAIRNKYQSGELPGNCHKCAVSLMSDLINAGQSRGWKWITGSCPITGGRDWDHSWLEYGDWAIDASQTLKQPDKTISRIYFDDAQEYRSFVKITKILSVRDDKATKKWVLIKAQK